MQNPPIGIEPVGFVDAMVSWTENNKMSRYASTA